MTINYNDIKDKYYNIIPTTLKQYWKDDKSEIKAIMKFIKANPFITYENLHKIFIEIGESENYKWLNEVVYLVIKSIYEEWSDKIEVRKAGNELYEMGGMDLMRKAFYLLANWSNFRFSGNANLNGIFKGYIEYNFNGVGEWCF